MIQIYNEGSNDSVVNFAQLTQRAGNFLVAREEMKDTWFGVTYQEDKEAVMEAFKNLTDAGVYPQGLYK